MLRHLSATACVFLLCTALLAGNSYVWLVNHVPNGDAVHYLLMAEGHFERVNSFHRYRVLVPMLANALAQIIVWTRTIGGGTSTTLALGFSFYVLNTLLLASASTFIYRTARIGGASFTSACCGALAVISSGMAMYITGSALIDSLAICTVAVLFYALTARHKWLLFCSIVIMLLAKEQLVVLLPVAFYYGRFASWMQRITAISLSFLLLFVCRYQLDILYPITPQSPSSGIVQVMVSHIQDHVLSTCIYLFTWKGLGDILVAFGGFTLLIPIGFTGGKASRRAWLSHMPAVSGPFLLCVVIFVLLSGDVARMTFYAAPCFGVAIALILQYHPAFIALRRRLLASIA
ncbi:hypothetical protein MUN82_17045 [Hymenobacter aerilatus]|uniref:Glycosyltransferase RgtA/B/C/D-like domain-containing protein n=1 Tax=Hymenobacter aerilatus TaxID=2932251 RepID=A0A8T9SV88_9BACT|nr:hypothetical protein [Hymenobacter aerilatus]UOR04643.1 hypothetical protein MUN82_17045 [Hymenobacter aerilatus]